MYHDDPARARKKTGEQAPDGRGAMFRLRSFLLFGRRENEGLIDSSSLTPIGAGLGSVVCKAHDQRLGMDVAVKIALDDDSALYALWSEMRILRKFAHPNVVKYLGSGRFTEGRFKGHEYLEMEYLEGQNLRLKLEGERKIGWEEARGMIIGICDALQAAHDNDIVHRDAKPSNIFLTSDGAKLLDFGVARLSGLRGLLLNKFEQGNIHYSAPECFALRYTPASDQYAAGAILYESLSGQPPYTGDALLGNLVGSASAPKPLKQCSPLCPGAICDAVDTVVMRALSRDPKSRFPSMAAMKSAIESI